MVVVGLFHDDEDKRVGVEELDAAVVECDDERVGQVGIESEWVEASPFGARES